MSTTQDKEPACELFNLPAESRNRIYRLALHKTNIPVSPSGFPRESLLSVNKQIRSEALKTFYYENNFKLETPAWSSNTFKVFYSHMRQLSLDSAANQNEKESVTISVAQPFRSL